MLAKLEEVGVAFAHLRSFLGADWEFVDPNGKRVARSVLSNQRENRWRKDSKLSFGASEAFVLVPLMLELLERTEGFGRVDH